MQLQPFSPVPDPAHELDRQTHRLVEARAAARVLHFQLLIACIVCAGLAGVICFLFLKLSSLCPCPK